MPRDPHTSQTSPVRPWLIVAIWLPVALSLTGCQIDIGSARGGASQERRASRAAEDDPETVAEVPALSGQESVEATVAAFRETRPQPTALPPTSTATMTPVPPTSTPTLTPLPTATIPPTPTSDPFVAAGRPLRLEVPALGVDALVEEVGLTADRAMDVPKGWQNVGWYNRGYRPGEAGNSVIAGHLDTTSGGPAVFWDLAQLLPGDELSVTYENGDRYTFVVQETGEFDYNAEGDTIDRIFGDSPTEDLNLITCQGTWDRSSRTYDKRLVVFSTLLPERTVRANESHGAYD